MDVEFQMHPHVECDDWRQAQLAIRRDSMSTYMSTAQVALKSGETREVYIAPFSHTVRAVEKTKDPGERARLMNEIKKNFLKVHKKGLSEETLGQDPSDVGFDEVTKLLGSCCVLHELDVPEPEVKYQCSCTEFWHRYKCQHSLAMSILKKNVAIPARYRIENIGEERRPGRVPNAHGGGALDPPVAAAQGRGRGRRARPDDEGRCPSRRTPPCPLRRVNTR